MKTLAWILVFSLLISVLGRAQSAAGTYTGRGPFEKCGRSAKNVLSSRHVLGVGAV